MIDRGYDRFPADAAEREPETGPSWNVIASVRQGHYHRARRFLRQFGAVAPSGYLNVLVMRVDDPKQLLDDLAVRQAAEPAALAGLGHVRPIGTTFAFQFPEEFEARARETALAFLPELAGKGFHVRMHRHGFKGKLSTQEQERLLGGALMEGLAQAGTPGRITFTDPDAILAVQTLGNRAGLSLWARDDLQRHPLLGLK
jgi:hypothetical protein